MVAYYTRLFVPGFNNDLSPSPGCSYSAITFLVFISHFDQYMRLVKDLIRLSSARAQPNISGQWRIMFVENITFIDLALTTE